MIKLALITEIPSPYRIEVFNLLAEFADVDLTVYFLKRNIRGRDWGVHEEQWQFRAKTLRSFHRQLPGAGGYYYVSFGVGRALRHSRPDVVIVGGYNHTAVLSALHHSRREGIPCVMWVESTVHELRGSRERLERLKATLMASSARVVVPGSRAEDYVKAAAPRSHVWHAPNSVGSGFTTARRSTSGAPLTILYVGRVNREKGVFDLIEASAHLSDIPHRLRLVGSGRDVDAVRRFAAELGVDQRLQLVGFRQPEVLPAEYQAADMFAFPTWSDPWGLVLNEAMASGLPVVASAVAGASADLVLDGCTGFKVPPQDPPKLAAALRRLLTDQRLRESLGQNASRLVGAFTSHHTAEGLREAALGLPNRAADDSNALRRSLRGGDATADVR